MQTKKGYTETHIYPTWQMTDSADTALIGWPTGQEQASVEEVAHFLNLSEQESQEV